MVGPAAGARVLVALGGNAMSAPDGSATEAHQIAALTAAAEHLADLAAAGFQVAVTHGNGPQVGNLLVKNELAADVVPPVTLDWCVAQTQATIGFVLCNGLEASLTARGLPSRVAALVTRTLVDPADPAFGNPTKPIGRYRTSVEAARGMALGQAWQDFGDRGWRQVVASPEPIAVLDAEVGRALLESGTTVVLAGGGGVPVVRTDGRLAGVDAVIDKDLAAALLADNLDCDVLVIATDVERAVLGYGSPDPRPLGLIDAVELQRHLDRGEFGAGSMGPKVSAAIRFAGSRAGRRAVITSLDRLADAVTGLPGSVGTVVGTARPADVNPHEGEPRSMPTAPSAIEVRKIPLHNVSDASELEKLIDDGVFDADRIIAVIGKTEGNGGVNDYTRIIADRAFRQVIEAKGSRSSEEVKQIPIVWSGGTDGVISPHATVFATLARDEAEATDEPRLTVGFAMSEPLLPEEIGFTPMISKVAAGVKVAMERAGIDDPADVHYVQTKTPLLTIHTIRDAKSRGQKVWTENTHESMDLSNGCTALGVAVALGEIEMPTDDGSMCSSSARRRRTVRYAGDAMPCSTTRTCTGTGRSSPASVV